MKLIIGLGNPETSYDNTRHNLGFRLLDAYAKEKKTEFQHKDKFKADIAEVVTTGGEKVLLVKPTTYYNLSGEAARAIADFYKIAVKDMLLVHDELALPLGTIRTRRGGSDAGNNGIKSITAHIGVDTARLRIGVYSELRDRVDDVDFVLGRFTAGENKALNDITQKAIALIDGFIENTFDTTTHK